MVAAERSTSKCITIYTTINDSDDDVFSSNDSVRDPDYIKNSGNNSDTLGKLIESPESSVGNSNKGAGTNNEDCKDYAAKNKSVKKGRKRKKNHSEKQSKRQNSGKEYITYKGKGGKVQGSQIGKDCQCPKKYFEKGLQNHVGRINNIVKTVKTSSMPPTYKRGCHNSHPRKYTQDTIDHNLTLRLQLVMVSTAVSMSMSYSYINVAQKPDKPTFSIRLHVRRVIQIIM
ncbi:hypothetical protein PR048_026658 [Dryococelus australis]|uniref:Uncharacterized protein n=1 Tax=Dryococelus australis TaxID=614101 RepID=A0ABQ9GLZ6_9NEOP|nr:hypothetical protein PR048_026658 [Dryococelus australis]